GFCDAPYVVGTNVKDNLPWTKQDGWKNTQTKTVKVAVILAELSDVPHVSVPKNEQPCKLIPAKTYPNGHDKTYYDDMMVCVKDYYLENSYGTVNIEATVFPTWYQLFASSTSYIGKERGLVQDAIAASNIDPNNYFTVAVVYSGYSGQNKPIFDFNAHLSTQALTTTGPTLKSSIIVAEKDPVGFWTHEIGHTMGGLVEGEEIKIPVPDLYKMGLNGATFGKFSEEGQWELMALGGQNGGITNKNGSDPSLMSSYVKEFLKLLSYDIKPKSAYDDYIIPALNQKSFSGSVLRYNLLENTNENDITTPYYILEARKRELPNKIWDTSIPKNSALVVYYVNPLGFSEYGISSTTDAKGKITGFLENECRIINIPSSGPFNFPKGGVLGVGDTYYDYNNLVSISASGDSNTNGNYFINARIRKIDDNYANSLAGRFKGFVVKNSNIEPNLHSESCKLDTRHFVPYPYLYLWMSPAYQLKLSFLALLALMSFTLFFWIITRRFRQLFVNRKLLRKGIYAVISILALFFLILFCFAFRRALYETTPYTNEMSRYGEVFHGMLFTKVLGVDPFYNPLLNLPDSECPTGQICIDQKTPSLAPTAFPDLDLHAITTDGKHVGVNYTTGEYENQIAGSIPSGDNQGSPEWILIPDGIEARYYVSSHDNQTFLNENPDIAGKMNSTQDSYEVYARIFDPASGIFTSATTSQTINPGSTDFYQITGTTNTPNIQSNNTDPVLYLKGIRDYVTAMPTKNKGTKSSYLSQLANIERSLSKKQTKPAISQIQALEKETNSYIKTKLIAKTDGEALSGMLRRLKGMVGK
ncbi:MAG: hypothetical protein WCT49_03975, partial [Candidatus Paceibacterota bacterium]